MAAGGIGNNKTILKPFNLSLQSLPFTQQPNKAQEAFVTYPGAVCNKGVDVVFGLVVVKQATPGQKCVKRLSEGQINTNQPLIKNQTALLVGQDGWADKVSQSIFNHVLHQVGPKYLLIVNQECCLDSGYN